MTFDEFEKNVIQWAEDRGIFEQSEPLSQWIKTLEETSELLTAILRDENQDVADAIGDIIVTLVIQARMHGLNVVTCCGRAWDEIKDRKGRMVDGMFVKEAG